MNRNEFLEAARAAKIPPVAYSADDGDGWDTFGIGQRLTGWELYYSERGARRTIRFLDSESKAFDALYRELISAFTHHFPATEHRDGREFRLLSCPGCHRCLRLLSGDAVLRVRCPDCHATFILHPTQMA
ncbi:hypothetical protein ACXR0O_20805 [Verrucomicrobiota bacterium sgz303538]